MSNQKLKRTTDRNDYSFIVVKILDFIVTDTNVLKQDNKCVIDDSKRMERTSKGKWIKICFIFFNEFDSKL